MSRPRTGYVYEENGKIKVRTSYTDGAGKRHWVKRTVSSKSAGHQVLRDLLNKLEDDGHQAGTYIENFQQLADWYERVHGIAPVYQDDFKIAGLRGLRTTLYRLRLLREHFTTRRLATITYGQLETYKLDRLKQTGPRGKPIKLATVHRELSLLRLLFNLAVRENWIKRNPFNDGKPLIVKAHETSRVRLLSLAEETRLLSACVDEREHLKGIVIAAIDTGMRSGEIFSLTWEGVNLPARTITIKAQNTKTLHARQVPISTRLLREIQARSRCAQLGQKESNAERVFGVKSSVSKAWATACEMAGLADLRFHDLRHTFDSRLVQAGINSLIVARLMGHAAPKDGRLVMTYRYTHLTDESNAAVIQVLDRINAARLRETEGHKRGSQILNLDSGVKRIR